MPSVRRIFQVGTMLIIPLVSLCAMADKADFYVSPAGNDSWSGILAEPNAEKTDGPFATVERAQQAVREMTRPGLLPENGIRVILREGMYALTQPVHFGPQDSGEPNRPVVYRAAENEKVILTGTVPVRNFTRHEGSIYKSDLRAQGLEGVQFSQLYYGGERMHLARVPNFDAKQPLYGGFAYVPEELEAKEATALKYDPETIRPAEWKHPQNAVVDIFPGYNYGNRRSAVKEIDLEKNIIRLESSLGYKPLKGDRFFIENVFEELDAPGEWYLDQEAGVLYFWAPSGRAPDKDVRVPITDTLVEFKGESDSGAYVHDIELAGLELRMCRKTAFTFSQAEKCRVAGCTIADTGEYGIELMPVSRGNRILSSEITRTGSYAVFMTAPLFKHEQNSGNQVTNNHIHHYGTIMKEIAGVGIHGGGDNAVTHNLIHHSPRWGVFVNSGARNRIEYNHIHDMSLETEDTGAIYLGTAHGGWEPNMNIEANKLHRGNIIRYNRIHDTLGYGMTGWWTTQKGTWTKPYYSWSIYLDLATSGTLIYGNVCYNSHLGGLAVGGGQDNIARNNIFIDGKVAQISTIKWEPDPPKKDITVQFPAGGNRFEQNIICYSDPDAYLYWFVYQYGSKWQADDFYFNRNLIWHNGLPLKLQAAGLEDSDQWQGWMERGMDTDSVIADPLFVDAARRDYRLRPGSPAWKLGFERIPVEKIGLYRDEYRTSLK